MSRKGFYGKQILKQENMLCSCIYLSHFEKYYIYINYIILYSWPTVKLSNIKVGTITV